MFFLVKNLDFVIANNTILSELNFSLDNGSHLIISGPSGSGKSTLINLMSGLYRPTSGHVSFESNDYSKLTDKDIDEMRAKNFGLIFQRLHLIKHLTVEQNILLGFNKIKLPNIEKLIEDIGLTAKKKQLAKDLSFGESQRVAIARGVVNNPKIIFADEPTSSLDDENTTRVLKLISAQANKNKSSIVISTHDERVKKFFKNILEIKL
jgi:putative ABC transport system ATP-binding protein|tara:strand:+ start:1097 stop:1720 length:624 start_codon:yes stop_codon:yes gene_type:complete